MLYLLLYLLLLYLPCLACPCWPKDPHWLARGARTLDVQRRPPVGADVRAPIYARNFQWRVRLESRSGAVLDGIPMASPLPNKYYHMAPFPPFPTSARRPQWCVRPESGSGAALEVPPAHPLPTLTTLTSPPASRRLRRLLTTSGQHAYQRLILPLEEPSPLLSPLHSISPPQVCHASQTPAQALQAQVAQATPATPAYHGTVLTLHQQKHRGNSRKILPTITTILQSHSNRAWTA